MDSPAPVTDATLKRKRSPLPDDARPGSEAHPRVTLINYFVKNKSENIPLIEGDPEIFTDILTSIEKYEGVLQRNESLSANLGAKLVGPLLLKSFDKLFDGPIKIVQTSFALEQAPVTWLDIVTFARTNSGEFYLAEHSPIPGYRTCRFGFNGGQLEISEDDYRLIMSGGPERMIPTQPIADDESAELATLNIVESRLAILIKKADAVASKARQLNYHLKGRKTAVMGRRLAEAGSEEMDRTQPFSAINARSPAPPSGELGRLQQELLEQFLSYDRRQSLPAHPAPPKPKAGRMSTADLSFFTGDPAGGNDRRMSHGPPSSDDFLEAHNKTLMATKIEKLERGDRINPPCDRCRRLRFECTKHLTACQACTKKHAKCSWRDLKLGELNSSPPASETQAEGKGSAVNGQENGNGKASGDNSAAMDSLDEMILREKPKQDESMATQEATLALIAAAASQ